MQTKSVMSSGYVICVCACSETYAFYKA